MRDLNLFGNCSTLTLLEADAFLATGELPSDYRDRVAHDVSMFDEGSTWCANCGGVGCMHFVFREWYGPGIDECQRNGGWCCPSCRRPARDAA